MGHHIVIQPEGLCKQINKFSLNLNLGSVLTIVITEFRSLFFFLSTLMAHRDIEIIVTI